MQSKIASFASLLTATLLVICCLMNKFSFDGISFNMWMVVIMTGATSVFLIASGFLDKEFDSKSSIFLGVVGLIAVGLSLYLIYFENRFALDRHTLEFFLMFLILTSTAFTFAAPLSKWENTKKIIGVFGSIGFLVVTTLSVVYCYEYEFVLHGMPVFIILSNRI